MKKIVSIIIVLVLLFSFGLAPSYAEENTEGENVMSSLSDTQRNSIGVLNYLAYLTKDIEAHKDNKMYLEEAYSALYNNTYMNAIDAMTLGQVKSLLTALNNFKMLTVKRERLEYIYEQNQAQAIRDAIPSPLAVMNIVQSGSWQKALVSVVYMAMESATSYYSSKNSADLQYLRDGWELEDEESEILHQGHLDSLEYMWEIITDYNLPGDLAINENDIDRFVDNKNNKNLVSRILFFESNKNVYQAFGEYWLTLAESYYEKGDMEKCLEAVKSYEAYSTRIFRKDYHYAKVLPMAITAAGEVYDAETYEKEVSRYASRIIANCDQEDWVLRYFAAETYVDLAGRTSNNEYLNKAYNIAINNVNNLARNQIKLNQEYMAELKPVEVPEDSTNSKKEEIQNYNKGQAETRKTAVPPASNALVLNCDLLFSLADKLQVDVIAKDNITGVLYGHGDVLFLNPILNSLYSFDGVEALSSNDIDVSFDGKEIKLPARYLTDYSEISVGVLDSAGKSSTINGWKIQTVNREKKEDLTTFTATLTSEEASHFSYSEGSTVWINFNPYGDEHTPDMQIFFSTVNKVDFLIPYITFQRIKQ